MADIELLIKMPEEYYKSIKDDAKIFLSKGMKVPSLYEIVIKGTPLPKGHGRLIDENDLDVTTITTDDYSGNEVLDVVLKEDIDNAHTIIDADKENENIKTISSASKDEQTTLNDALEKIRTGIKKLEYLNIEDGSDGYDKYIEKYEVLRIIDECKAESLDARLRENDDLER